MRQSPEPDSESPWGCVPPLSRCDDYLPDYPLRLDTEFPTTEKFTGPLTEFCRFEELV